MTLAIVANCGLGELKITSRNISQHPKLHTCGTVINNSSPAHRQVLIKKSRRTIERFHQERGLLLLLAVATGFYMQEVPSWESLPPKY